MIEKLILFIFQIATLISEVKYHQLDIQPGKLITNRKYKLEINNIFKFLKGGILY